MSSSQIPVLFGQWNSCLQTGRIKGVVTIKK
jgi:hypothetical protein